MKFELIDFGALAKGYWPIRKHDHDAGADVYAIEGAIIGPMETVNIPLGFGFKSLPALLWLLLNREAVWLAKAT